MTALARPSDRPHRSLPVLLSVAAGVVLTLLLLAQSRPLPALLMALATAAAALAPLLRLPRALIDTLALAAVLNAASIDWDWYDGWAPFDEWAHLLNPIILVAPSMVWLHRAGIVPASPTGALFAAAAATYGLVLAVGWEVVETVFWVFPLSDTASDVGLGTLGAALGGLWAGRLIPRAGTP